MTQESMNNFQLLNFNEKVDLISNMMLKCVGQLNVYCNNYFFSFLKVFSTVMKAFFKS